MSGIPTPTLCRLEYLTPKGWVIGHAAMNLLRPENYVKRLSDNRKFGRATELDDELQPTGQVWVSPDLPDDPSVLVFLGRGNPDVPQLPEPPDLCQHCDDFHVPPFDGSCLL